MAENIIRIIKQDAKVIAVVAEGPQGPSISLPSNVAYIDTANEFSASQLFSGVLIDEGLYFREQEKGGTGSIKFSMGTVSDLNTVYSICHAPATVHDMLPAGNPGWLLGCDASGTLSWKQFPDGIFTTRIFNQSITGTQDGSNNSFSFGGSDVIVSGSLVLFRGGMRQQLGIDYSVNYSTKVLTFNPLLESGEVVIVDYTKEGA